MIRARVLKMRSWMYPLILLLTVMPVWLPAQHVFKTRVAAASDDAEEAGMDGEHPGRVYLHGTDLELAYDAFTGHQLVGLRFTQVALPQGTQIVRAYIQFTADETDALPGTKVIRAEDTDHALTFTFFPHDLSDRPTLADSVVWSNLPLWERSGDAGPAQQSEDITGLVQQLVNRPGWQTGNAMCFLISGTGQRIADSFDGAANTAPELVIEYLNNIYPMGDFPVSKSSVWKYDDSGMAPAANWAHADFDDSSWAFGLGRLGYGHGNENTILDYGPDPNNKYPTYYFRHEFEVTNAHQIDSLLFHTVFDDGMVVYLNGEELFRRNMPSGPISHTTYANVAVAGYLENYYQDQTIEAVLQEGKNILAVEVHQHAGYSLDLVFDMQVSSNQSPLVPAKLPFFNQSDWQYRDSIVNLDGTDWKLPTFDDTDWQYGQAPLGYGNPDLVRTQLSYGNDESNRPMTAYFRREVVVNNINELPDSLQLGLLRDDGAVIYVNGTEVWRSNMPVGPIVNGTPAASSVGGSNESRYFNYVISSAAFEQGMNIVAVEVHQRTPSSSDLTFDLEILPVAPINPQAMGCNNGDLSDLHIGCFVSQSPLGQQQRLGLPGTHRFQLLTQKDRTYTNGDIVPAAQQAGAFLSTGPNEGRLWITHDLSPGMLSAMDLFYDEDARLWGTNLSEAVDFEVVDYGETGNFRSAQLTPWGTLAITEAGMFGGDLNADGFADQGWTLEVNAQTGMGTGQKNWGLGRIPKENLAISPNGTIAYFGSKNGAGLVFKYVLDQPNNLSQGQLYVLHLNEPLTGAEPRATAGNWVSLGSLTPQELNFVLGQADSLGTHFGQMGETHIHPSDGYVYIAGRSSGRIYRFVDTGNEVSDFETYLGGQTYKVVTRQGIRKVEWGNGNTNFTFDNRGNMWVLQQQGDAYIWLVRPDHTRLRPRVELFAQTPLQSAPTGISFSPDYRFLFLSLRNPSPANDPQPDATMGSVRFNKDATIVIARREYLGPQAPDADFDADVRTIAEGDQIRYSDLTLPNPDSVRWNFPGGIPATSTDQNPVVLYPNQGTYDAELIAYTIGGSDTLRRQNFVQVNKSTSIEEVIGDASFSLYPNPMVEQVHLDLNMAQTAPVKLEVLTLDGKELGTMVEKTLPAGKHSLTLPVEVPAGAVVLRMHIGTGSSSHVLLVNP